MAQIIDFSAYRLGLIHAPHPRLPRIGAALVGLSLPPKVDWHQAISLDGDALGNDQAGNCVQCGVLRAIQIMRSVAAGDTRKPSAAEALALYRAWAGWDGTAATDLGTRSDVAAAAWGATGVQWGDQWLDLPALAAFSPAVVSHLRAAIAWLGPVQIDLDLPAIARDAKSWEVVDGPLSAPGSWGPHRVCVGKYDNDGFYGVTWGMEMPMTEEFVETYALAGTAAVSRSWLDVVGHSPLGLDLDALEQASRRLAA